jgi:hypothetical protein
VESDTALPLGFLSPRQNLLFDLARLMQRALFRLSQGTDPFIFVSAANVPQITRRKEYSRPERLGLPVDAT